MLKNNPYIIFYIVCLVALFTIILLFLRQIVEYKEPIFFNSRGFDNSLTRGSIFFSDKNDVKTLAATSDIIYNFILVPYVIEDVDETYGHLNELMPISKEKFLGLVDNKESKYKLLKRGVTKKEKREIEKYTDRYNLKSLQFEKVTRRYYPFNNLAAQVVGFVSSDEYNDVYGKYGIENSYNDTLNYYQIIAVEDEREVIKESFPDDVVLTIDKNVQKKLEDELLNMSERWNPQLTGGIVMDPNTGKIVAMTTLPSFNLNEFNNVKDYSLFNNPNVESVYEMGSVFKPLTVAIGIDSKRITVDDTYNDKGFVEIDGHKVSNFDEKGRGPNTSIQKILSQSLNTGAVHILQKVGIGTFKDYFDKFGFNSFTRIELPKEVSGIVSNLETNREIEYATASFGHGIAVTPISAIRALASLANGGILVQPYIVDHIIKTKNIDLISKNANIRRERRRIFNEETTKDVTKLLETAFSNSIISQTFNNRYYNVAAKTGTAQLINEKTGKYYEDKYLHSFFGYFPASNPEYIIFLYSVDPKTNEDELASTTMSPSFNNLTNYIISYYNIPPDK